MRSYHQQGPFVRFSKREEQKIRISKGNFDKETRTRCESSAAFAQFVAAETQRGPRWSRKPAPRPTDLMNPLGIAVVGLGCPPVVRRQRKELVLVQTRRPVQTRRQVQARRPVKCGASPLSAFIHAVVPQATRLRDEIQALLMQNSELILARVSEINRISSEILGRIDIFLGIAKTLPPIRILSQQAIDIIRIFYTTPEVDQLVWVNGEEMLRLGHTEVAITIDEPAFLPDDLNQLLLMGLLSEQGIYGGRRFNPTRIGQSFVKELALNSGGDNL